MLRTALIFVVTGLLMSCSQVGPQQAQSLSPLPPAPVSDRTPQDFGYPVGTTWDLLSRSYPDYPWAVLRQSGTQIMILPPSRNTDQAAPHNQAMTSESKATAQVQVQHSTTYPVAPGQREGQEQSSPLPQMSQTVDQPSRVEPKKLPQQLLPNQPSGVGEIEAQNTRGKNISRGVLKPNITEIPVGNNEPVLLRIEYPGVPFFKSSDRRNILPEGKAALLDFAELIQSKTDYGIVIVMGHADAFGQEDFNKRLSLDRAQRGKQFLRQRGITHKIIVYGIGEANPARANLTPLQRSENRRLTFFMGANQESFETVLGIKGSRRRIPLLPTLLLVTQSNMSFRVRQTLQKLGME